MELSVLDLFSGIGGFSVGLEATGKFKTIAFCEKDKFCQKVLQKHWNDVPIYEDIKKLDARKIKADVVVGGFPCQSFSTAGKRKGTEDDRYLFPEMLRIIKETQARWVVGENVQGIVNMSEGKVLQGIHNDLETIGYEVQTFIIPASSQGAWHKRNRVWIVAANTNNTRFKNRNEQHWGKQTQSQERNGSSSRQDIVSNTKKFGMERLWAVRQQKPEIYGKENMPNILKQMSAEELPTAYVIAMSTNSAKLNEDILQGYSTKDLEKVALAELPKSISKKDLNRKRKNNDSLIGLYTNGTKLMYKGRKYKGNYHYNKKKKQFMSGKEWTMKSVKLDKIFRAGESLKNKGRRLSVGGLGNPDPRKPRL